MPMTTRNLLLASAYKPICITLYILLLITTKYVQSHASAYQTPQTSPQLNRCCLHSRWAYFQWWQKLKRNSYTIIFITPIIIVNCYKDNHITVNNRFTSSDNGYWKFWEVTHEACKGWINVCVYKSMSHTLIL